MAALGQLQRRQRHRSGPCWPNLMRRSPLTRPSGPPGPRLTERSNWWNGCTCAVGALTTCENRYVEIGPASSPGMAGIWGQLPLTEGAALDARLDELAATVCREDPRTKEQRRIDSLCAVMAGQQLHCGCGSSDCPAGGEDKPAGGDPGAGQTIKLRNADLRRRAIWPGSDRCPPRCCANSLGAQIKPNTLPPKCESGYRPSAALAQFCALPGLVLPISGLRQAGGSVLDRLHDSVPARADTSVESQAAVRFSSLAQDVST